MRLIVLLPLLITACAGATMESGGFTVEQDLTQRTFDWVGNRAAFELRCPKEQLKLVVLNVLPWDTARPSQIGVDGCGARAVYVPNSSGWVMNTESVRTASRQQ